MCSSDLGGRRIIRSEEHTSELQSLTNLVCRLLLEKTKAYWCAYAASRTRSAKADSVGALSAATCALPIRFIAPWRQRMTSRERYRAIAAIVSFRRGAPGADRSAWHVRLVERR